MGSSSQKVIRAPLVISVGDLSIGGTPDGTKFLRDDGTWQATAGGGGDTIVEGDTSVEVIDTGSDGSIVFTTDGTPKWSVTSDGHFLPGTGDAYDIGSLTQPVREIYLSTNSLKFIDNTSSPVTEHTLSITGDQILFDNQTISSGSLSDLTDVDFGSPGPVDGQVLTYSDSSPSGWIATDSVSLSEVNDLSSSVTWVNVPDANITSSSVTQHSTSLEGVLNHDNLVGFNADEHIDWTADQTIGSPDKKIHSSNIDFPDDIDHDAVTLVTTSSPNFVSLSGQELTIGLVDLTTDVTGLLPIAEVSIGGTPNGNKFLRDDGTWAGIPGGISTLDGLDDVESKCSK